MPRRIETYKQAFELIEVAINPKIEQILKQLESEGRSEKSISFAIWKSQDKLKRYKKDVRFISILINEIKRWSWASSDPRWNDYNKRKAEEQKAEKLEQEKRRMKQLNSEYKKLYPGFIYFIQGQSGGPIKIGYAENVKNRIKTLQTGYFETLIILATYPGGVTQEKQLHERFNHIRLRGEWFKPEPELLELIDKVNKSNKPSFDKWLIKRQVKE